MPVFTIAPVNIQANTLLASPAQTLSADINSATIQMTDSVGNTTPAANSNWLKTTGNVQIWGVQISSDGGTTWNWLIASNDPSEPSSGFIAFGRLTKSGQMPILAISSGVLVGQAGNLVRLAILTDTNIKLGAVITVN